MVVREPTQGEAEGCLCIPQTQHAAISGQLARAWGNDAFPAPDPQAEICLAAARHDDGMDAFDADPDLDAESGLPRGFMRMPLGAWLDCWERGPASVAADSPYAAMLVSLHGEHLLGYRQLADEDAAGRERVDAWLETQGTEREAWSRQAGEAGVPESALTPGAIESARKLIETWDAMSLAVCMPRLPQIFEDVPAAGPAQPIEMVAAGEAGGPQMVEVDPWPFAEPEVPLAASGRRLSGGYSSRDELREALAASEPEQLSVLLVPPKPADERPGSPLPNP